MLVLERREGERIRIIDKRTNEEIIIVVFPKTRKVAKVAFEASRDYIILRDDAKFANKPRTLQVDTPKSWDHDQH